MNELDLRIDAYIYWLRARLREYEEYFETLPTTVSVSAEWYFPTRELFYSTWIRVQKLDVQPQGVFVVLSSPASTALYRY